MPLIKAKAKIKKGNLNVKVKYPLVGGAELELGSTKPGSTSILKALVKVPFLFSAKFLGLYKPKKQKMKKENKK